MSEPLHHFLTGRLRKLALVVAFAATALLAAPTVAAASTVVPDGHATPAAVQPAGASACPSTWMCFWVNAGYGGAMGKFAGTNSYWGNFSEGQCQTGTWNDCASSIYNHDATDVEWVYINLNYGGAKQCLPLGTEWSNLTQRNYIGGGAMNDNISSNKLGGTSC